MDDDTYASSSDSLAGHLISEEEFLKFREFFYRKTGINFEESKRYFVDKRIIERIFATGNTSFRGYFTFLRFQASGEELQAITNLMTVNETYFLREGYQFDCLVESMLPEILKRKKDGSPIRIWCIPSSSGEEPYSIAMYLLERWPAMRDTDIELIASDIDTEILQKARAGRYSARSIQHVPVAWLRKYFTGVGQDFQISDELRQAVDFTRVNITEPGATRSYRNFDVVFCRNLLIYFDDVSRKLAAEAIFDAMNPGGFVCLGHSESMSRISPLFGVRKFPEAIIYQRPEEKR
ncbi:MAG: protein-glutamate O-methyltransferase CheR [Spirochaetota bacterium]